MFGSSFQLVVVAHGEIGRGTGLRVACVERIPMPMSGTGLSVACNETPQGYPRRSEVAVLTTGSVCAMDRGRRRRLDVGPCAGRVQRTYL